EKESLVGFDRLDGKLQKQTYSHVFFYFIVFLCEVCNNIIAPPLNNTEPLSVLYLQFTVWISWASRRWRQNEGLAVKGMPLKQYHGLPLAVISSDKAHIPPETNGTDLPTLLFMYECTLASISIPTSELSQRPPVEAVIPGM
ncbi:hypothetical protein XENOCAPTIV_002987, partial [Xenoophorus captivus]